MTTGLIALVILMPWYIMAYLISRYKSRLDYHLSIRIDLKLKQDLLLSHRGVGLGNGGIILYFQKEVRVYYRKKMIIPKKLRLGEFIEKLLNSEDKALWQSC